MAIEIPNYIERAGIVGVPLDCLWRGPQYHLGPMETVNKMFDLIASKTTCGMLTQAAGIISWGAWRLHGLTDVSTLLHMVEASFAFQVHPYYVDQQGAPTKRPPEKPPAVSAAAKLQSLLRAGIDEDEWWHDYYQPHDTAFHSAYLVRHIMPKNKKKAFSDWLERMLARIKEVAPKPKEDPIEDEDDFSAEELAAYYARHWGQALPPQVLDPEFDYEDRQREELVDRFLRGLSWKGNPFLRSPKVMKELGFEGSPYQLR